MLASDARALRELAGPARSLPPHLVGIPPCLHKYEPLLRESAPIPLPIAQAPALDAGAAA